MCFKESHITPIILVLSAIFIALLAGCPMLDTEPVADSPPQGETDSTPQDETDSTPPGEMVAPTLVPGNRQITATWTAPADGGSPITGYELQYREVASPAGSWIPETDDPAIIVESTATSHPITGLTNGTAYEVQVYAVNITGSGTPSESAIATPAAPPHKLAAPTLVPGNGELTVHWTPPNNGGSPITEYELQYREVDSPAENWIPEADDPAIIVESTATSHTITGMRNSTAYEVRARAVNVMGKGDWSEPSAGASPVGNLPMRPTALVLTAGDTQIIAAWTAPTDDGGSPITYELQYREVTNPAGSWLDSNTTTTISPIAATRYTITGLTNGTEYEVQVYAVNVTGSSTPSESASATPAETPPAPAAPTIEIRDTELVVHIFQLRISSDDGGSAITASHLRYREIGSGGWTEITSGFTTICKNTENDVCSHTITGLTNGNSYEVQVRFVNAMGVGEWGESAAATPAAPPSAPDALTLVAGDRQITATWTAPADDGGSSITGYELLYYNSSNPSSSSVWEISGITSTSHTITGLTNGIAYGVVVLAVNKGGNSPWSAPAVATPVGPPVAPAPMLVAGGGKITATWTPPNNGGSRISSYHLQYKPNSTSSWGDTIVIGSGTTTYEITGLRESTRYDVRMRARNRLGLGDWSQTVSESTFSPPSAPAAPTLVARSGKITATWKQPANGGSPIFLYHLQYKLSASNWMNAPIIEIPARSFTTTYDITGLDHGTKYDVRILARNAAGLSDWSEAPSATTLAGNGNPKLRIVGYTPYRDFDYRDSTNDTQYFIEDNIFDYLTDAILLTHDILEPDSQPDALQEFKTAAAGKRARLWFSSTGSELGNIIDNPTKRAENIRNVVGFIVNNDFYGLDIDWEYPSASQWPAYNTYLTELKAALHAAGKKLSIASQGFTIGQAPDSVVDAVDYVNVMAYDKMGGGGHATYSDAVDEMNTFLNKGFTREQINIGVAFYGRHTNEGSLPHDWYWFWDGNEGSYRNIRTIYPDMPSSQDVADGYVFNNIDLIKRKTNLAINENLGGLMIWEMGFDLPLQDPRSLLRAMVEIGDPTRTLPSASKVSLPVGGGLKRDLWLDITGDTIADLTNDSDYPHNPDYHTFVYDFVAPKNWRDNYGQRIYGYITPQVTGTYTFWIAADNQAALYFGSSPDSKQKIASIPDEYGWTNIDQWDKYSEQQSVTQNLVAGTRYYVEVIHKAGGGDDHVAVAWQISGGERRVIRQKYLEPYTPQ
ncbi:MAG: fibronectin type III domain-containing protein [Salinispira sp.]